MGARFSRHNQPVKCRLCGKVTAHGDHSGAELCKPCYDAAGLENEHNDYGHTSPVKGCPACAALQGAGVLS